MTRLRLGASACAALLALVTLAASAPAREPGQRSSLLGELGVPAAERLLVSDASPDRRRGLARLSAIGTPRAIELMAQALDPGGAARGAQEHLAAVRALAPHASHPLAQAALVRALSSPPVEADAGPLSDWVQSAAALSLSRSGAPSALAALGRALRKPGRAAQLAKEALVDNPPRDLTPLVRAPGAVTKELCEALGALGDQRAQNFLRDAVRRGAPDARGASALALSRLGETEVLDLARHWLLTEKQPVLLAAAAQILSERGAPEATQALANLAASDPGRALALFLATGGKVPAPATVSPTAQPASAFELLRAFALGGDWATARLEQALHSPETASLAVYALSQAPGERAEQRLERALSEPSLRAFAIRALALRRVRFGSEPKLLSTWLGRLERSSDPAERAAATAARALLSPDALAAALGSSDPVVVRSAAKLASRGEAAKLAVIRLRSERSPATRVALAMGLVDPAAADLAPTQLLLDLTHDAGPAAWIAAAALAARKDADLLPLVRELLASGDPWLRAHALLGLGRAPESDALGLIDGAYAYEPDEDVRLAAVIALSQRSEPVRLRTLRLAAELDGSRSVREAARLALSGDRLAAGGDGADSVWVELVRNPGLATGTLPAGAVRLGAGLARPFVSDPDGVALVGAVVPARLEVRLALLEERVNGSGARP